MSNIKTTVALPEPDEHADLTKSGGEVDVPVWHLNGSIFEDLGEWVRAASSGAPMEIAGHDVDADEMDVMEHDLLVLLAAIRASRALGAASAADVTTIGPEGIERAVCMHDNRPIARRTDRPYRTQWHHDDERGARGCADGAHEAEPFVVDA